MTNLNRRTFCIGLTASAIGFGQELVSSSDDTDVRMIEDGNEGFMVGVRTRVKADRALVTVFYKKTVPDFGELLLSKDSMAPVAGWEAYGATRDNFTIPRDHIQRIEVLFLNDVAIRFAKAGKL